MLKAGCISAAIVAAFILTGEAADAQPADAAEAQYNLPAPKNTPVAAAAEKSAGNLPGAKTDADAGEILPMGDRAASQSSPSVAGKVITRWPTGRKLVALTYDDGPNPQITPKLLELLKEKNVKATFYLLGKQVEAFESVAADIARHGHEVANHTFTHPQLTKHSKEKIQEEISSAHELITSVTGAPVSNMRPPFGAHNLRVQEVCQKLGYAIVLWDVDTNDWRKRSAQAMIDTIMGQTGDGSIILMHDRYQSVLDTTAAVIDRLRAKGYEFVTVSELLSHQQQKTVTSGQTGAATKY